VRDDPSTTCAHDRTRFEVLPFSSVEEQARRLPGPVRLTVTCPPKHGPDRAVEFAARLHALGHPVTVHVAARMVRDRAHLNALLAGMADAGSEDLFLIGGDAERPLGPYSSAGDLLRVLDEHPRRPRTIGIAGYPEGHPAIPSEELEQAVREKSRSADYVTTQMCFDSDAVRGWLERQRRRGMTLPVLIGMPGKVSRRRLLEMSVRIGVGPSVRFVRKQHGLLGFLSRRSTLDRLDEALAPLLGDPRLDIAGVQYFTFNQLVDTWEWHAGDREDRAA
jgi:methylenetetrahydrofolate reductase (NADPH)